MNALPRAPANAADVVEHEPVTDLLDIEQIPLPEEGRSETFGRRDGLL